MIKLGSALYAHKEETVEITCSKVGEVGMAGIEISAHRGAAAPMTGPKMSIIGMLFDLIYIYPGKICAYNMDAESSIYCEIGDTKVWADGKEMRFAGSELKDKYRLIPDVLWELSYGKNTELLDKFTALCRDYSTSGSVKKQAVMGFCDSYYYGCAKNKVSLDDDLILDLNQIEAAFRSGALTPMTVLYSIPNANDFLKRSEYEKACSKKKSEKNSKKSDFLADCKAGVYHVSYTWPENMKRYIVKPSFLDTFESTPEFEEIVKKIKYRSDRILERMDMGLTGADAIGKDQMNIMLLGKPGTGKTTLAYALSAATGMPVCTTAWNKHSDEDEEEGKTKIVDGKPTFVETDALLFHQYGGIDVNEEINLADPSVTMGCLGQKTEFPFIVKKNGYETIVRHPLNVVIATMNVGTNGSNPLNQALANRFKTPYILDDPTRETFINILEKASGKAREICEWVYQAYEATVDYLKSPDVNEDEICQNLSIRTCLGAIDNMEEGQTPIRALINSIVGAVAVVDLEVARNLQHEKIECLPNPEFEF